MEVASLVEHLTVSASAPDRQEVLDYREVRESSARDAGEALARLDGLWKIRKGGIASDVVLRGFQQGNINVLIDGARIAGACPNHMDPPAFHVDFAEVQQVEVTKGAFDLANQGSLGGAVNIVSKAPGRGLRLTPNLSTGLVRLHELFADRFGRPGRPRTRSPATRTAARGLSWMARAGRSPTTPTTAALTAIRARSMRAPPGSSSASRPRRTGA